MRNRIIALCLCVFISMSICLFSMAEELYEENYRSQYGPVIRVWGDDQRLRYEYVINDDDTVTIVSGPLFDKGEVDVPQYLDGKMVTVIGKTAYSQTNASVIILYDGIITIDKLAFADTRYLSCVVLPESVKTIGDYAFLDCGSLEEISIPDSVTDMGENPFAYCGNLCSILVSDSHPAFSVQDGVLFDKSIERLICYPSACQNTEYTVPDGVKTIDDYAFAGQENIWHVDIADSVTEIGKNAFRICYALEEVGMPASLKIIKDKAFMECPVKKVIFPDGLETIGTRAFFGCQWLQYVKLPASVKAIGEGAFGYCSENLTLIVEKNSVAEKYAIENEIMYSYTDIDDFEFIDTEWVGG